MIQSKIRKVSRNGIITQAFTLLTVFGARMVEKI